MATEPIVSKLRVETNGNGNGNGNAVTEVEAAESTAPAPAISNGVGAQPMAESDPSILAGGDSASGHWVIRGDGDVLGEFTGEIDCAGTLVVGKGAVVSAIIRGNDVVIAGLVRGNIVARAKLRIASSGRLEGDARVGALVVMEGGVHHGVIRVHPEGVPDDDAVSLDSQATAEPEINAQTPVDRVKKFWGEFF
ncbi:MAG: polymer-forming cytoskeletal protein [Candidatus Dormibacter sp.]